MARIRTLTILLAMSITFALPWAARDSGPGIPVTFTLDKPACVTLVIEDDAGRRIWNLIGDTQFEAGQHTLYWDGYDVGTPLPHAKSRWGTVDMERHRAAPGVYRLRGLVHDGVALRYEMAIQSPGNPPWHTGDGSGAWLSDHSTPSGMVFLPMGSPHGKEPQILVFATGGGLDLFLRTDPTVKPRKSDTSVRSDALPTDVTPADRRLFITRQGDPRSGRVRAVLYIQEGGPGPAEVFESPIK